MTKKPGFFATVPASALLSTLSKVALVIERRNTIPVLGCFQLEALKGSLVVSGSNLDTEIRGTVAVAVSDAFGKTCVPAAPLVRFLRACAPNADELVEFSLTPEDRIKVSVGASSLVLYPIPADDFPTFPQHDLAEAVDMPGGAILYLISAVSQSISTEDTRYYLNGICLEFEGSAIRATATNGHIMSTVTQALTRAVPVNSKMILPRLVLPILNKIVGREQCVMNLCRGESGGIVSMRFDVGDFTIKAKLIDGTFPDWRRVIPTDLPKDASFQLPDFLKAVGISRAAATERGRASKLVFDGAQLRILVNNPDQGDTETRLECSGAEGLEIGFNSTYLDLLLNAVKRAGSKSVRLLMSGPGDPSKIVGDDDAYGFHIIMPMRI